ncbi:MAG: transcription elongation factor GreA [Candidatus Nealsonbacteria bacterium]
MEKYITAEGLEKLKKELVFLKENKRREIAERLEKCISFGDLAENSEYHETKEAQGFLEGRILELEDIIKNAVIVPEETKNQFAQVGSTVLVKAGDDTQEFKIVGVEEGDPVEGKISVDSPLGKALINQPKGVIVEINTPGGRTQYKIVKIE